MQNFLRKLDRQAGRLIESLDADVHEPITHVLTGEVFTHEAPQNSVVVGTENAVTSPVPNEHQPRVNANQPVKLRTARQSDAG